MATQGTTEGDDSKAADGGDGNGAAGGPDDAAPNVEQAASGEAEAPEVQHGSKRNSPGREISHGNLRQRPITYEFRPFTRESLQKIRERIEAEAREAKLAKELKENPPGADEVNAIPQLPTPAARGPPKDDEDEGPQPNPLFEVGKQLPPRIGKFPPELFGKPIEDLDDFYHNKYTFMVIARDLTIFRFSAHNALYLMSPFNPVRRAAIFILTHPFFSLSVMVVILVNCIIMASPADPPNSEEIFTAIYTVESTVKILARGFILADFTYLRDMWNWLDFCVVAISYATIFQTHFGSGGGGGGKFAALRTFRVLRALKTVAVVPGLKTIVGALMEAVRRLRDVMILSLFVLSIFALIGRQLYSGKLRQKCVRESPLCENLTDEKIRYKLCAPFYNNEENWYLRDPEDNSSIRICGWTNAPNESCPFPFVCRRAGMNPNDDNTSFDNFPRALLCAFRLMTQDFWENLYWLTLWTNGEIHMLFFVIVIFMGSFYLVNVILAIVAMSYDDCRKQEALDAAAEDEACALANAAEAEAYGYDDDQPHSPSVGSAASLELYRSMHGNDNGILPGHAVERDRISMKSDCVMNRHYGGVVLMGQPKPSLSLPGSPFPPHRTSRRRSSQFSWRKPPPVSPRATAGVNGNGGIGASLDGSCGGRPMVIPCLDNLELPYADDSAAVTPTSEDLCNFYNAHYFIGANYGRHRLSSSGGSVSRMSQLESRFTSHRNQPQPESYIVSPYQNQLSPSGGWDNPPGYTVRPVAVPRAIEPTHFHWNTSSRRKQRRGNNVPADGRPPMDYKAVMNYTGSSTSMMVDWDHMKGNKIMMDNNPFLTRTPSANAIDMQDVLIVKDLIKHAAGKKRGLCGYEKGMNKKEFLKEKCFELMFGWECHPFWYKIAHIIELFVMDAFVDLFITLCIVVNTLFMAMEHADMNPTFAKTLTYGNYVFTTIFTVEAVLKILALGMYRYLQDKWNCFDIVIVVLSLVELGLDGVKGLSILRSFRLLRVFKLAKSWPTLNLLIGIIGRTMGALGNLCFVLAIIIFIFAVMGKELFKANYEKEGNVEYDAAGVKIKGTLPRWHFCDFLHAFMIVFRVLCGEWIESMWGCIKVAGFICIPFFLLTMIIGNLVVLNLFLALLLSSFGAESLKHSQEDEGPNKLQEAVDRIARFIIYVKSHIAYCIKVKIRRKALPVDYYFYSDDQEFHAFSNPCTAVPMHERSSGNVVVTIAPMGNGRIREAAESIPEEPDGSPQHCSSKPSGITLTLLKGSKPPHAGYSPVSLYEPEEENIGMYNSMNNYTSSIKSEPSTVIMSKASSRNSCTKPSSSAGSHSDLMSFSRDSIGSPRSPYSSAASDFYLRDDDVGTPGVTDRPPDIPEINEVNVVFVKYPDECCPKTCSGKCPSLISLLENTIPGRIFWKLRCYMYVLVEHNYFETFIITMIITSSLALAVEDIDINNDDTVHKIMKVVLEKMDRVFTVIFVFEMVIKMMAYGFKKYFTDAWCWLDFVIVVISLISWTAESIFPDGANQMSAFRALRTLRALRPLRAVSRWEGMKVVVNALIQAIPSIFNVLLVCLVFWLIFSIMGVNLFSSKYGRCIDKSDGRVLHPSEIYNRTMCLDAIKSGIPAYANYSWYVPKINFNSVPAGYLALFQVATFKGWMTIMEMAIDSASDADGQPHHEAEERSLFYLYFVLFIVFGSFFTLNLFIGVIIENFNMQKKKAGGSLEMLMTEDQKKYYNAMKKLGSKQPTKPIPKPKFWLQLFFYEVTKNQKFDIAIMVLIMLNMLTMAIEFEDQPEDYTTALEYINLVFIVLFTAECLMKLLALRFYYFKEPWNVFDFFIVITSIVMQPLQQSLGDFLPSPTLLRVVRVFRVGRVLRLVKSAKGIRTLLFSLAVSMPALFNIGLLLFLVMFIFSIFGMNFFMYVKKTPGLGIDDVFNFETFFRSMIVLFQTCTSAGWDGVLAALMQEYPDCNPNDKKNPATGGDCGSTALAIVYLVSYLVITFLVVINMYIAVILENFSQATEDVQQGLTQDDFDMYYETWEKFDENATQYIPLSKLSEFVDTLEEPLRLPAPNLYKLVSLDIPICEDDRMHCVDILDALTKNFLGTVGDTAGDLGDLKKGPERVDYNPISSTLKRQREMFVARLIQRSWRNFVKRRHAVALLELDVPSIATASDLGEEFDAERRRLRLSIGSIPSASAAAAATSGSHGGSRHSVNIIGGDDRGSAELRSTSSRRSSARSTGSRGSASWSAAAASLDPMRQPPPSYSAVTGTEDETRSRTEQYYRRQV